MLAACLVAFALLSSMRLSLSLFYSDSRTAPVSPLPFFSTFRLLYPRRSWSIRVAYRGGPPARSRQFTISKHKQKYEWLQVGWDAVATGLAGSKWWGRDFWDAKRLAWQSLSVSLRSRISLHDSRPNRDRRRRVYVLEITGVVFFSYIYICYISIGQRFRESKRESDSIRSVEIIAIISLDVGLFTYYLDIYGISFTLRFPLGSCRIRFLDSLNILFPQVIDRSIALQIYGRKERIRFDDSTRLQNVRRKMDDGLMSSNAPFLLRDDICSDRSIVRFSLVPSGLVHPVYTRIGLSPLRWNT